MPQISRKMRKLLCIGLCALALSACQNNNKETAGITADAVADTSLIADADAPKVTVEKAIHEFGDITQGQIISYEFKFKNTGKTPLIITDAIAACGCTVPEYPRTPIKPGGEGTIKVIFDSTGKLGLQDRIVTINSNSNPKFEDLHLVGNINEKK